MHSYQTMESVSLLLWTTEVPWSGAWVSWHSFMTAKLQCLYSNTPDYCRDPIIFQCLLVCSITGHSFLSHCDSFCTSLQNACTLNYDWIFVLSPKFICWSSNFQCGCIWRWGWMGWHLIDFWYLDTTYSCLGRGTTIEEFHPKWALTLGIFLINDWCRE